MFNLFGLLRGKHNQRIFGLFVFSVLAVFIGLYVHQNVNNSASSVAGQEVVYSDEVTNTTETIENGMRVVTEFHENARIPYITVYEFPIMSGVEAAVPPAQNVGGTDYYRVTSTDPNEDTGDEVCAIATGTACEGVQDDAITGFNVCLAYNPTAAEVTDVNGDLSVTYCDGAPQTGPCAALTNSCLACPTCSNSVTCSEPIGTLYREMYTTCAAAEATGVGLNAGVTTLATTSDLNSQVSGFGVGQGAYTWSYDGTPFMSLNMPFNSGATQENYSGSGIDGAIIDIPTFTTPGSCQVGGCLYFDGANDQVNVNQAASALISSTEGTVSVWVKPTRIAPVEGQAYTGDDVFSSSYFMGISQANIGGQDRFWAFNFDGAEDRVGVTYTVDEWVHLVWVHGGGKLRIYKNGVLGGEVLSGNTQAISQVIRIGGAVSFGTPFQGYVDEVQIYPNALSPDQIAEIYDNGNANVAGPRSIISDHIAATEEWDLSVTYLDGVGAVTSTENSTNTVTISANAVTVGINNSGTSLDTYTDITTEVTGILDSGAAYTWTENANPFMQLNIPFNSGSSIVDVSGNSRDGALIDGAFSPIWQSECQVGGCLFFDGVNDQVDTNVPASTLLSSTEGTVSVWAKPTRIAPVEGQAYTGDDVFSSSYFMGISQANIGGQDRFWAFNFDGAEDRVGVTYTVDEWIHLVWVHGGGKLRIYKNGVLGGEILSGNTQSLIQEIRIGSAVSFGTPFQGYIDEVSVWNKALTEEEIAYIFADGDANLPGPSSIDSYETITADNWDLSITPLSTKGTVLSATNSGNTVDITAPTITATLNLGGTSLSTFVDLSSSTTGLWETQAAYIWEENSTPYSTLNMPFNSGSTQFDYSGNGFDGTVFDGAFAPRLQGECQVGHCFFFDGVNDQIDLNQPLSSLATSTEATISVWAKPTRTAPTEGQAYTGDDVFSATYRMGIAQAIVGGEDRFWAFNYDGNEDRVGVTYSVGEWIHLTLVHGGGVLSIYKNGVLIDTTPSGNTQSLADEVRIGSASSFGTPFQGYIDEVQTWKLALSANQVAQLYSDGSINVAGSRAIQSQETVSGDEWELSIIPFEEDGTPLPVVDAGTVVTITIPPTSVNINSGNISLSTTQDLISAVTGIGDPQLAYTWMENSNPFTSLNLPLNLGATQFDYSGNGYDSTVVQGAFSSQGQGLCQVGGCYFFDGVDDQIDVNQPLSSIMTDTQGTMSAWVKPTRTAPTEGQAYTGDDVFSATYRMGISQAIVGGEDRFWAFNFDGDEDRVGAPYTLNEWTHLVWSHGGGQLSLYKDGVLIGSVPSGNTQSLADEVRIGSAVSFGTPFQGYIDEVQAWSFPLSANQIEQLYTDGNGNVAGPSKIISSETIAADIWGLSVTPFKGDGSPLSLVASTNTTTIAAPSINVELNGGSGIIDPSQNLLSVVTGLGVAASAYEWSIDSNPFMTLNYPFNAGALQTDYSGNGHDGDVVSASFSIEGQGLCQVGACFFFDGVNDQIDVNEPLSSLITNTDGTVSVWVRPTRTAPIEGQAYTGDDVFSATYRMGISQANVGGEDRFWAFNFDGDEDRVGAPYTINEWTHLVWSHSGGQLSLYKDGVLIGSIPSGNTQSLADEVRIGSAASFGTPFQGYIDEVQTWNFAVSEDQIGILYADGLAKVAGPTEIADEHVNLNESWNVAVTPFESDGTPFTPSDGNAVTGFVNTPPDIPTLVSPLDGSTLVSLSPTLSAGYSDINIGHVGTVDFRVSSGSAADCLANIDIVNTGTSALTSDNDEDVDFEVGIVLTDLTTYNWCTRSYDSFDYSNGGAFTTMGAFLVDTSYSPGGGLGTIIGNQGNNGNTTPPPNPLTQLDSYYVNLSFTDVNGQNLSGKVDPSKVIFGKLVMTNTNNIMAENVFMNLLVPETMSYVPGSITINTIKQTDSADADKGQANQTAISGIWAQIAPQGTKTILFQLLFKKEATEQAVASALAQLQASVSADNAPVTYVSNLVQLDSDGSTPPVGSNPVEEPGSTPTEGEEGSDSEDSTEGEDSTDSEDSSEGEDGGETENNQEGTDNTNTDSTNQDGNGFVDQQLDNTTPGTTPTSPTAPTSPIIPLENEPTNSNSGSGSDTTGSESGEESLFITGSVQSQNEQLEFTGTVNEPNSDVVVTINGQTFQITSDENGAWQAFVSAEQLGVQQGQSNQIQVEAIATKGGKTSNKIVQQIFVERLGNELVAKPVKQDVSSNTIQRSIEQVTSQAQEFIQEREEEIQTTLVTVAPVVIVTSIPIWGYLPYVPTMFFHLISWLLGLFGRKKQEDERFYGIVYDSISKQPVPLAIVRVYKLIDSEPGLHANHSRQLVQTVVTDKQGRYEALLETGEYEIEVKKPQFSFPSSIVTSASDGEYTNLYQGSLISDQGIVNIPDIPLDPENAPRKWQTANLFKKLWLSFQKVSQHLAVPVLFIGAGAGIVVLVNDPSNPLNWILSILYILMLVMQISFRIHPQKAWGMVYDIATNAALPLTTLQLIDPEFGKVVKSRLSDYEGRFSFLPEPGKYVIKANKEGYMQADVIEAKKGRNPLTGEVQIQKEGQTIDGDIAMITR